MERCQRSNLVGPTTFARFEERVSALVVFNERYIEGNFCEDCINELYKKILSRLLV